MDCIVSVSEIFDSCNLCIPFDTSCSRGKKKRSVNDFVSVNDADLFCESA